MRPTVRKAIIGVAAVVILFACADENSETPDGADPAGATSEQAFPVTIETAFEAVTIEEPPRRIVALGWGDAEVVLALGGQPVGASDWLEFGGDGVGPWSEGLYEQSPELIDTLEPSYEAVAALEPDLILDVKGSGDQQRYDLLSGIATTIGIPEGGADYMTEVTEHTQMIAQAMGVPERGQELLDEVDEAFAAVRAKHPEWEGLTVTAVTRTSEGWGAYIEGNQRVEFLRELGFTHNPAIDELGTGATGFSVDVSAEQLELVDADLVVAFPIWIETSEIADDPLFNRVPAVDDGRVVIIDDDLSLAYSLGTTVSRRYAIDQMAPLIDEALA